MEKQQQRNEKLEFWHKEIKQLDKLSLEEILELNNLMLSSLGEKRQKYREKLILGTLYLVYGFVCNSGFDIINSTSYDIEDVINVANEVWIEMLDSGELIKTKDFRVLFGSEFYHNVISKLGNSQDNIEDLSRLSFSSFGSILEMYIKDINNGIAVDFDRVKYYLKELNINRFEYNYKLGINKLYNILVQVGSIINLEKAEKITKTELAALRNLLLETSVYDRKFDISSLESKDYMLDIEEEEMKERVKRMLLNSNLTEKQKKIIIARFGLLDGQSKSFEEVGQRFGFTKKQVREIEISAMRKLRHPNNSYKVRNILH